MADGTRRRKLAHLRSAHRQSIEVFVEEGQWFDVLSAAAMLLALDTEINTLEEQDNG